MIMPKQRVFLVVTAFEVALLVTLVVHGRLSLDQRQLHELPAKRALVRHLGLTDLAIWTEARYTRNPSQADLFSAFQDFPSSLEHFPAGSIVPAPLSEKVSATAGR